MEAFILGGGASTRMGVDKARVAFPGRDPLAVELARVLREGGCSRVALVRRERDGGPWPGLEVLEEPAHPGTHPLYGVAAALAAAREAHALVVSCDLPWLTSASVRTLLQAGPCVARGERLQPLVAVWPSAWAERVRQHAEEGGSARALATELPVVDLDASVLRDLDDWRTVAHDWPVQTLLATLPPLGPEARRRVVEGELGRLWARGAVDPHWIGQPGNEGAQTPAVG